MLNLDIETAIAIAFSLVAMCVLKLLLNIRETLQPSASVAEFLANVLLGMVVVFFVVVIFFHIIVTLSDIVEVWLLLLTVAGLFLAIAVPWFYEKYCENKGPPKLFSGTVPYDTLEELGG